MYINLSWTAPVARRSLVVHKRSFTKKIAKALGGEYDMKVRASILGDEATAYPG